VKEDVGVEDLGAVPPRCGYYRPGRGADGLGFGYRKLVAKGRWNSWSEGMIGATLENPAGIDVSVPGTKTYYSGRFTDCNRSSTSASWSTPKISKGRA
jgi:hypothetical protein